MDILTISNLNKSFGDKKVLRSLDLSVPSHSIFGFVGKNGAGKTTTMKAVLGLLKPDSGDITVNGQRVVYGENNRHIGYLPDVPEFYSFMTAREYLKLSGECLGMSASEIKKSSDELLSLVGLENEEHRIKGFSRGMKQRLGIAQALIGNPELIILDEPTSALDPVGRKEILDILVSVKEYTTVLFSTHILSDVERICTDVAFLHEGKIVLQGGVSNLRTIRRSGEITVELKNTVDASVLLDLDRNAELRGKETIAFVGDDEKLFEILSFISEKRIPVSSIEQSEPSLEALFLEVTAK